MMFIFGHLLVPYRRDRKDKCQEKGQGERQGSSDRVPPGKDLPTGKRQLSDTEGVPSYKYSAHCELVLVRWRIVEQSGSAALER